MMGVLERLYAALSSGLVAALAVSAALIFTLVLFPASARKFRPPGGKHIIHLQLAFTVERFRAILEGWADVIPDSLRWLKESVLKLDYAFPVLYATAFASIYASISSRDVPTVWDMFFVAVPFVAGAFDWIENTLHLFILRGIRTKEDVELAEFSPGLILSASLAASLKFSLLAGGLVGCFVVMVQALL